MGCDWYDISHAEQYGVLISNKMIKKARNRPWSTLTGKRRFHGSLDSDTMDSVVGKVKEYHFCNTASAFTFSSQKELRWNHNLSLPGHLLKTTRICEAGSFEQSSSNEYITYMFFPSQILTLLSILIYLTYQGIN